MTPPQEPRCTNCGTVFEPQRTNCPHCGASRNYRVPSFSDVVGWILGGVLAAIGTALVWGTVGFLAVGALSGDDAGKSCVANGIYDIAAVGIGAAALFFGIRLARRRRTGLAVVLILAVVCGYAPATICTATFLQPSCRR